MITLLRNSERHLVYEALDCMRALARALMLHLSLLLKLFSSFEPLLLDLLS